MQMGGERPLLRLVGVVHELLEGDDILAGDGGLDFRLAPLRLAPRCLQVLRTRAHAHGARSARDVAIVAVLGPGALLIAADCD